MSDAIDSGDLNPENQDGKQPQKPLLGKKVTIGGREFEVSDEMAAALEAQQASYAEQAQQLEQRLTQRFEQAIAQPQQQVQPANEEDDDGLELLTDPKGYLKKQFDKFGQEFESRLSEQQSKKNNLQIFWDGFYNLRPDLKSSKEFVQSVFSANASGWASLTFEQTWKKLSEKVDSSVKELLKGKTIDENGDRTTVATPGGAPSTPQPEKTAEDAEREARNWHLTSALRQMHNNREKLKAKLGQS